MKKLTIMILLIIGSMSLYSQERTATVIGFSVAHEDSNNEFVFNELIKTDFIAIINANRWFSTDKAHYRFNKIIKLIENNERFEVNYSGYDNLNREIEARFLHRSDAEYFEIYIYYKNVSYVYVLTNLSE